MPMGEGITLGSARTCQEVGHAMLAGKGDERPTPVSCKGGGSGKGHPTCPPHSYPGAYVLEDDGQASCTLLLPHETSLNRSGIIRTTEVIPLC
jgi:hypothetical protein